MTGRAPVLTDGNTTTRQPASAAIASAVRVSSGDPEGARPQSKISSDGLPVGQGERILVVEDEPTIRELVVETLEGLGYTVIAAGNAAEALDVIRADREIDLLFTDIVMPGSRDGVDLAEAVRTQQPDVPVLFTSGYAGRSPGRAWPRGVPLLQKPYRIGALARAIRSCLDG